MRYQIEPHYPGLAKWEVSTRQIREVPGDAENMPRFDQRDSVHLFADLRLAVSDLVPCTPAHSARVSKCIKFKKKTQIHMQEIYLDPSKIYRNP